MITFVISLLRKSIRAHVRFLNIKRLKSEITKISKIQSLKKSIRAHVRYRAFATLQIELYCITNSDSKWSTKFQ